MTSYFCFLYNKDVVIFSFSYHLLKNKMLTSVPSHYLTCLRLVLLRSHILLSLPNINPSFPFLPPPPSSPPPPSHSPSKTLLQRISLLLSLKPWEQDLAYFFCLSLFSLQSPPFPSSSFEMKERGKVNKKHFGNDLPVYREFGSDVQAYCFIFSQNNRSTRFICGSPLFAYFPFFSFSHDTQSCVARCVTFPSSWEVCIHSSQTSTEKSVLNGLLPLEQKISV